MENLITGLRKLVRRIGVVELILCKIIISWIVLLTGVSILLRYGFNYSLHWSQEIILLSAQYLYFLGAAYIFKVKEYIIMEYFFTKLPEMLKIPTIVTIHLLMLFFLGLVVWQSFLVIMKQWSISSFVLNLPRGHWTIPVFLGCISIALTLTYYLLVYLKHWRHDKKPRPDLAELEIEMDLCL
jgi:TRAP-type C4-dicarboxylate transport system permease small subunit